MATTHYSVLGLDESADSALIRVAYRAAMKRVHPDQGGDPMQAKRINEAYEILSDAGKRSEYDRELAITRHQQETARAAQQAQERAQPSATTTAPNPGAGQAQQSQPAPTMTAPHPEPDPVDSPRVHQNAGYQSLRRSQNVAITLKVILWGVFGVGGVLTALITVIVLNAFFPELVRSWRWLIQLALIVFVAGLIALPIRSYRRHLRRKAMADYGLYIQ